jgi:AbrB family looped-hinge helix DNA binding protein
MPYKTDVTLTSKGQLTLPAALRKRWQLKAGDRLTLEVGADGRAVMTPRVKKSILQSRMKVAPLSLGRPLSQADIDAAVASAMAEQELRIKRRRTA